MTLFHKTMDFLGRYRLIRDRRSGEDYLHRYYLFLKDRKKFPINFVLHNIVRSDDPIMHDHPWPFMTIILAGGYWEHTPLWNEDRTRFEDIRTWKGPGSVIIHKAEDLHWLELDNEQPAKTLFFMGPQEKAWGFIADKFDPNNANTWVEQNEYLETPFWKEYHMTHVEPSVAMTRKVANG